MRFFLKKKGILRNREEIQNVFDNGRYFVHKSLVLYCLRMTDSEINCDSESTLSVGFITGKKIGCAVVRNRLRRVMRESFRLHEQYFRKDAVILLVGRKAGVNMKRQDFDKVLLSLMKKAGLLKDDVV